MSSEDRGQVVWGKLSRGRVVRTPLPQLVLGKLYSTVVVFGKVKLVYMSNLWMTGGIGYDKF